MSLDVVDRARHLWDESREWPDILRVLREEGYTKLDSIRASVLVLRIPLGAAKPLVHSSEAWADTRAKDEKLHEVLELAALEFAASARPTAGVLGDETLGGHAPASATSTARAWEIELQALPTGGMPSEDEVRRTLMAAIGDDMNITDTRVRVKTDAATATLVILVAILLGSMGTAGIRDPEEAAAALRHQVEAYGPVVELTIRPAA